MEDMVGCGMNEYSANHRILVAVDRRQVSSRLEDILVIIGRYKLDKVT